MRPSSAAGEDEEHEIRRRYSTFIGSADRTGLDPEAAAAAQKARGKHCKLCIRPFTVFRRRVRAGVLVSAVRLFGRHSCNLRTVLT